MSSLPLHYHVEVSVILLLLSRFCGVLHAVTTTDDLFELAVDRRWYFHGWLFQWWLTAPMVTVTIISLGSREEGNAPDRVTTDDDNEGQSSGALWRGGERAGRGVDRAGRLSNHTISVLSSLGVWMMMRVVLTTFGLIVEEQQQVCRSSTITASWWCMLFIYILYYVSPP